MFWCILETDSSLGGQHSNKQPASNIENLYPENHISSSDATYKATIRNIKTPCKLKTIIDAVTVEP